VSLLYTIYPFAQQTFNSFIQRQIDNDAVIITIIGP